jgi:hypothetical protein
VPKFLQGHAHLLGSSRSQEEPGEEALAAKRAQPPREGDDSDADDEADRQVLMRCASILQQKWRPGMHS